MRWNLLAGVLLVVFALGVVQADRARRGGETGQASQGAVTDAPAAPGPPPARTPSPRPRILEAGELSVVGAEADAPMVRYFDAEGSLHMVRGLERVPPEHRADAVVLGSGNVNVVNVPAPSAVAFQDWEPEPNPNRTRVTLFSAPWCGACKRARRHLETKGVAYRERDIDRDDSARDEVREILGRVAIPLLDVNGRYISGFRPDVYDRALGRG